MGVAEAVAQVNLTGILFSEGRSLPGREVGRSAARASALADARTHHRPRPVSARYVACAVRRCRSHDAASANPAARCAHREHRAAGASRSPTPAADSDATNSLSVARPRVRVSGYAPRRRRRILPILEAVTLRATGAPGVRAVMPARDTLAAAAAVPLHDVPPVARTPGSRRYPGGIRRSGGRSSGRPSS